MEFDNLICFGWVGMKLLFPMQVLGHTNARLLTHRINVKLKAYIICRTTVDLEFSENIHSFLCCNLFVICRALLLAIASFFQRRKYSRLIADINVTILLDLCIYSDLKDSRFDRFRSKSQTIAVIFNLKKLRLIIRSFSLCKNARDHHQKGQDILFIFISSSPNFNATYERLVASNNCLAVCNCLSFLLLTYML